VRETLGQRIRRLREAKKLGLREAAKKVGISPAYLSRIETNEEKTPPGEEVLQRVADLLGQNVDELMSLAGRVSSDVKEFIAADPGFPRFLRTVRERGYSAEDLQRLLPKGRGKK
jgi:transcriptional regulator with XRE-family HTH domain